jgi:hypothetical protein
LTVSSFTASFVRCVSKARAAFYAEGYELPSAYLRAVEAVRIRTAGESDYQFYLDEVLREDLAIRYPWTVSARADLPPGQKSAYLDALAALWSSGKLKATTPPHAILDPNFAEFATETGEIRSQRVVRFREIKSQDEKGHLDAYASIAKKAKYGNAASLLAMVIELAEAHGYKGPKRARLADKVIELKPANKSLLGAAARVVSLASISRRGDVFVQYVFDELPGKAFGLGDFVPGGHLYSEWNQTVEAIAFSFFVQCNFLNCLRGAFAAAPRS